MEYQGALPSGEYTTTIYTAIRDERYQDAIEILNFELNNFPRSRACLSLLAYCYYQIQDFVKAAQCYEVLINVCPDVEDYRLYLSQAYYKAGMYTEALRSSMRVTSERNHHKGKLLQGLIKYSQDDDAGSTSIFDSMPQEDEETMVNTAALLFKKGKFEEARLKYEEVMTLMGYKPDIAYNIALCFFKEKQFASSLKHIAEIIERGVREHPELSVGSGSDGLYGQPSASSSSMNPTVRSVGNSILLQKTCLIESFNLKAALEYELENTQSAKEALLDMPPRNEDEIDPVTLHNQALVDLEQDPNTSFAKLKHLLLSPPFPPPTYHNLLLLYIKYENFDLAADLLAENAHLTFSFLSQEQYEFLEAITLIQTSPEETFRKLDILGNKYVERLRKLTKSIQDARMANKKDLIRDSLKKYEEGLDKYIIILMYMCKIYWDREQYGEVEALLRQSSEFCSDHPTWKLNVGHTFYIQDKKYREAIKYYEPFVSQTIGDTPSSSSSHHQELDLLYPSSSTSILDISAIVLANLCVSYIMTSNNEKAEELMRRIEREEERVGGLSSADGSFLSSDAQPPSPKNTYHLCIVNLVIGTLYCSKGNYEFGISRIIKSMEPYNKKLNTDTWYYAKSCLLSLAENLAKHIFVVNDILFSDIVLFLEDIEAEGQDIKCHYLETEGKEEEEEKEEGKRRKKTTKKKKKGRKFKLISQEARELKRIYLKLRD